MKYRFFTLDQVLQSPLFDFSAPYQSPTRADRNTRSTRLETMAFQDACAAEGLDNTVPLLADLFHLLYAHATRWTEETAQTGRGRLFRHLLDKLAQDSQTAALRHLCQEDDDAAIAAAHTLYQALADTVYALDRAAGRLLSVLERLQARRNQAMSRLHDLVQQVQTDPTKTPEVLGAAAEAASTAEQMQAVSDMVEDTLRKQQPQTAESLHLALQQSMDTAVMVRAVRRCWGEGATGDPAQRMAQNRALLQRVKDNPALLDITRQLGRMKEMLSELRKNDYAHGRGEKYSLTRGRDLKNLLSGELALLASPATAPLFLRKYGAKGLLQYAKRERIRKGQGDVIVCLDESGSTEGENAAWGKALALAVQDICAHAGRKFALIHFSGAEEFRTDIFAPDQYGSEELLSAAEHFYGGMTDFETPLKEALRLIDEETFEQADILFITDGECEISEELAEQIQLAVQDARCSIVGLLLDADSAGMEFSLDKFCEKVLRTSEMGKEGIEKVCFWNAT